jgi:hypothetical protein
VTQPSETPGIGGVPGLPPPGRRGTVAWQKMLEQFFVGLPKGLRQSAKYRRQLRAVKRG